jgi:hypothetical protein
VLCCQTELWLRPIKIANMVCKIKQRPSVLFEETAEAHIVLVDIDTVITRENLVLKIVGIFSAGILRRIVRWFI